jgi:hypothetical protein
MIEVNRRPVRRSHRLDGIGDRRPSSARAPVTFATERAATGLGNCLRFIFDHALRVKELEELEV